MIDDPFHDGVVREESNDLNLAAALRTVDRVNLIDLADHLGPAFGGDWPELLHNQERDSGLACLLDLPPMGVGFEAVVPHRDLAFIGDVGSDPGDELQVVQPLHLSANIEYLSGYHWEKKGLLEAYGIYMIFPEGRGGRTTPPHMYVDLAVEKDFLLGRGLALGLGVNAYNILNSQRPVSFVQEDSSLFGQVWARQLPSWLQVKASLKF